MLLRGDAPGETDKFVPANDEFTYASDLIAFASKQKRFSIGAAAYPEKHPESGYFDTDIQHLKTKIDAGADFLITQMFFDNNYYFSFIEKARKAGIQCRIIPGIMPIINYNQIKKFAGLSHATIPDHIISKMESIKDNPYESYKTGVEIATAQCRELLDNGAPGLHFYTLNKSRAVVDIYESVL
jgi:methylenetetrahydrofolate reductase (NADPH)